MPNNILNTSPIELELLMFEFISIKKLEFIVDCVFTCLFLILKYGFNK